MPCTYINNLLYSFLCSHICDFNLKYNSLSKKDTMWNNLPKSRLQQDQPLQRKHQDKVLLGTKSLVLLTYVEAIKTKIH